VNLRAARAAAQGLDRPPGRTAVDAVRGLLAVQAQEAGAARLALRARTQGLTASAVDAALTAERSLVVAWLMRGTLHLVAAEDHGWLLALTAPARMTGNARRLRQEGVSAVDAERAVAIIERALADEGPLARPELAERIAAQGIRTAGQATPHLLALAALRGVCVLGPVHEGGQAFALARDWIGAGLQPTDPLAELGRRYLRGHGPATAADLATWSGLPLRDARAGLGAIAAELAEHGGGLVDLAGREPPAREALAPRLLPRFDPYLLGWRDRSFAVPEQHARRVHPGGGMLRAVATDDGAVVGTWTMPRGAVELEPFGDLDAGVAAALDAEAADVARFLRQ
jgi:winged helix DNA-binding protein